MSNISQLSHIYSVFEAVSYSPVLATSCHNLLSDRQLSNTDIVIHSSAMGKYFDNESLCSGRVNVDVNQHFGPPRLSPVMNTSKMPLSTYVFSSAQDTSPDNFHLYCPSIIPVSNDTLLNDKFLEESAGMMHEDNSGCLRQTDLNESDGLSRLASIPETGETLLTKSKEAVELAKVAETIATCRVGSHAQLIIDKKIYMHNLMFLSLSFFFVFVAFLPLQNLASSLYSAGNLGTYSLSILFTCYFIGCFFAPTLVEYLSPRCAMIFCFVPILLFALSNFFPSLWTLAPASGLVGLLLSTLWAAQATYLTNIALLHSNAYQLVFENVVANFNALFFVAYQLAQIIGCAVSAVMLMGMASDNVKVILFVSETANFPLNQVNSSVFFNSNVSVAFNDESKSVFTQTNMLGESILIVHNDTFTEDIYNILNSSYSASASVAAQLTTKNIFFSVKINGTSLVRNTISFQSVKSNVENDLLKFAGFTESMQSIFTTDESTKKMVHSHSVKNKIFNMMKEEYYDYSRNASLDNLSFNQSIPHNKSLLDVKCGVHWCPLLTTIKSTEKIFSPCLYAMFAIFSASVIAGIAVMLCCLSPLGKVTNTNRSTLFRQVANIFVIFTDWKAICLLPLMFYSLIQNVFLFGDFTRVSKCFTNFLINFKLLVLVILLCKHIYFA